MVVNSQSFFVKISNLERTKLTPKEERSRDSWRRHLVKFQYQNKLTVDEMNNVLEKLKAENIEKLDEKNSTEIEVNSQSDTIAFNPAYYVLNYLTPDSNKQRQKRFKPIKKT